MMTCEILLDDLINNWMRSADESVNKLQIATRVYRQAATEDGHEVLTEAGIQDGKTHENCANYISIKEAGSYSLQNSGDIMRPRLTETETRSPRPSQEDTRLQRPQCDFF